MTRYELLDMMPNSPRIPLQKKLEHKMVEEAIKDVRFIEYLVDAQDTDSWEIQALETYFKSNGFAIDIIPPATCLDYYTITITW